MPIEAMRCADADVEAGLAEGELVEAEPVEGEGVEGKAVEAGAATPGVDPGPRAGELT